MRLDPVRRTSADTEARYPSRHRVFAALGRWARRSAGAAAASGALVFGGCYGATPFDRPEHEEPVDPRVIVSDQPPGPFHEYLPREAGVAPAPMFHCSESQPEAPDTFEGWGYWEGSLCGELTAWAFHAVPAAARYEVAINYGAEWADLALLAPDGSEVAALTAEAPSAVVELGAGVAVLALTAADPVEHGREWVSISLYPTGE